MRRVVSDGNNVWHAVRERGPRASTGRETLVRLIERWAKDRSDQVTLVFDGAAPPGGMRRQMSSATVDVRFSAPATADDVIVELIRAAQDPARLWVISSDRAIRHEAGLRRCRHDDAATFVAELFSAPAITQLPPAPASEKPSDSPSPDGAEWRGAFGGDDEDEPFDGYEAMIH